VRSTSHRVRAVVLAGVLTVAIAGIEGTADAGAVVGPPGAPAPAVAVPFGNNVAKVTWHKSVKRVSPILGYTVVPYNGKVALPATQFAATQTTGVITGLKNGSPYHFIVEARSALGNSAPAQTPPMTVGAPLAMHAPSAVSNTAPNQLRVVFKAPKNGGAPITSYTVSCVVEFHIGSSATGPPVPFKGGFVIYVNGLKSDRTYSCRVKATNSRGSGPLSTKSPYAAVA
jgi:Fibronectin type III domain